MGYRRRYGYNRLFASFALRGKRETAVRAAERVASASGRRAAKIAAYREAPLLANLAVRGLNLAKGEFKAIDHSNTSDCNTTGTLALLNGIARGDDINERTGREVTLRSIELHVRCLATATTGLDQTHRVMLVYDRQTNAAALTFAQVLTATDTVAPRNLENRKRFKILMDRRVNLAGNLAAAPQGGSECSFDFYRRLRHPMTFNSGDAGTVADITTGSIYILFVGTVAPGAGAGSVNYYSRCRYEDK